MNFKLFLQHSLEKKIIHLIDYHFSLLVSKNKESILMLVAACVSAITREGHFCLPLKFNNTFKNTRSIHALKKFWTHIAINNNLKNLKNNASLGNGLTITPLVLSNNAIYLYRIWKLEKKIARFFINNKIEKKYTIKEISNLLLTSNFFSSSHLLQKISISISLLFQKSIIIGSPGTGKTTIIFKLILILMKLSNNKINIKLSATTGKAASQLQNSLKKSLNTEKLTKQEKKLFPMTAITLHNLLQIHPRSQKQVFHKNNVLNTDVLIIDEASMIDINMMNNIIDALSKHTKLILVGDFNQLPAVNNGLILKDLCTNANNTYSTKITVLLTKINQCYIQRNATLNKKILSTDHICILQKNYRFKKNSEIYTISQLVFKGDTSKFNKLFNNTYSNIKFFEINTKPLYNKMLEISISQYKKYWHAIYNKDNLEKIMNIFNQHRIICALNKGIFGTTIINNLIELKMQECNMIKTTILNKNLSYIGKPIILTKNQKSLGLFNGDTGIILPDKDNILKAFFVLTNKAIKIIPIILIQEYKTAWSITIHKSQGSEFNHVTMILPNETSSIITRELIYTGITRSKKKITIFSLQKNFLKAIKTKIKRFSNLKKLLHN